MHPLVVVQYHALRCSGRNRQFAVLRYVDKEDVMRQKHILTTLAIFAVTGAVSVPNSLAGAWRLDVSDRHVVGRGEGNPSIHKVADPYSGMSPDMRYDTSRSQQGSAPGDQSRQTGEYKSGSTNNESRYGANPSNNYLQKESSGSTASPTSPFSETIYGQLPSTPSADPLVRELSR